MKVELLEPNLLLITPDPDISKAHFAYDFYHAITKQPLDLGRTKIIIDLTDQSYVNSLFWSKIISLVQKVERIVLVAKVGNVTQTCEQLGISTLCPLASSLDEAKKLIRRKFR